jgi:large subunit ribosomal protein L21e
MVQKSYGKMRRTRRKMKSEDRPAMTSYLRMFKPGDRVHIDFVPSSPVQHPRFQGKTGVVVERRGRAYVVEVSDGDASKTIFVRPEHIKPQR